MVDYSLGLPLVFHDSFHRDELGDLWQNVASADHPESICVEANALRLAGPANCHAFIEHPLPLGVLAIQCEVFLDTDRGTSWGPGMAILWANRVLRVNVRSDGRFGVDDGHSSVYGGSILRNGWNYLAIHIEDQEVHVEISTCGTLWSNLRAFPRHHFRGDPLVVRLGKMARHGQEENYREPGSPGVCRITGLKVFGRQMNRNWFLASAEQQSPKKPHWRLPSSCASSGQKAPSDLDTKRGSDRVR